MHRAAKMVERDTEALHGLGRALLRGTPASSRSRQCMAMRNCWMSAACLGEWLGFGGFKAILSDSVGCQCCTRLRCASPLCDVKLRPSTTYSMAAHSSHLLVMAATVGLWRQLCRLSRRRRAADHRTSGCIARSCSDCCAPTARRSVAGSRHCSQAAKRSCNAVVNAQALDASSLAECRPAVLILGSCGRSGCRSMETRTRRRAY